jgi:hypothetical protein
MSAVQVFTIFWGAPWQHSPLTDLATKINVFFDDILASSLIDQLAEYNTNGVTIGHGSRIGTLTLATPVVKHAVTDRSIQTLLEMLVAHQAQFPQPSPNTLYFVYLPPGVKVTQGGAASCQSFCGYHNADPSGTIFYAVMPYPSCAGCVGPLQAYDALTSISSHELCEAITDPVPGQGWYDDQNGEIGDICAWQTKTVDGYTVQQEWSNQQGKCM